MSTYTSVIEPIGTLRAVIKPKCYRCGKPYYLVAEHLDKAEGHLCVRCERKIEGREGNVAVNQC